MIENHIRRFRRQRGLTLAQLGERIGTTPQSISRLETGVMKLSMDWVEKIAEALGVAPQMLLGGNGAAAIPMVGLADSAAHIVPIRHHTVSVLPEVSEPVAVKLEADIGPYHSGDILLFDRGLRSDLSYYSGRTCLVALSEGMLKLGKVMLLDDDAAPDSMLLLPIDERDSAIHVTRPLWIAPLKMHSRFYDVHD